MYNLIEKYAENTGAYLEFSDAYGLERIGTQIPITFFAFMQSFGQTVTITWDKEQVYGRNDEIAIYKNTKRSYKLQWNVPSSTLWEAKLNHLKGRLLMRMQYPRYKNERTVKFKKNNSIHAELYGDFLEAEKEYNNLTQAEGFSRKDDKDLYFLFKAILNQEPYSRVDKNNNIVIGSIKHTQTMYTYPLFKVKYSSLISDQYGDPLMGYLEGFSIKPNLEMGFFVQKDCEIELRNGTKKFEEGGSFPKVFSINCTFNVLHEDPLGFDGWTNTPYSNILKI